MYTLIQLTLSILGKKPLARIFQVHIQKLALDNLNYYINYVISYLKVNFLYPFTKALFKAFILDALYSNLRLATINLISRVTPPLGIYCCLLFLCFLYHLPSNLEESVITISDSSIQSQFLFILDLYLIIVYILYITSLVLINKNKIHPLIYIILLTILLVSLII